MKSRMEKEIEKLLSSISLNQKFEMISKNWLSHDARWQIGTVKYLGWDKGNKLNQDITQEMGKI